MTPVKLSPDLLRGRAIVDPDATAFVVDGVAAVTYGELEARSNAFGRGLIERGVAPGDRLTMLFALDEWIEYVVAFFGAQKAGAVPMPLLSGLTTPQMKAACDLVGATAVCTGGMDVQISLPKWHVAEVELGNNADALQVPLEPSAVGQILYTSGTTGTAKAVAATHEAIVDGAMGTDAHLAKSRRFRVTLHVLPVGVNASQGLLAQGLHRFARTVILPRFDPERFATLIEDHGVRALTLVPSMAQMVVDWHVSGRHDVSSVGVVALTGAPSPPALFPRLAVAFPNATIVNAYTLTETGEPGTIMPYDPDRPLSVGRPGPGAGVRILDDRGVERGPGEVGEVWLGRPGMSQRFYFGDPEGTAEVFRDGWARTGDLGYLDDEGYLYLTDRKNQAIISSGRNVSSIEVEAVLHQHPAVTEAAVFGVHHPILGEDVAAAVALRSPVTAVELRDFARGYLAEYQVPHRLVFVEFLPRNEMGKVLKNELRQRAVAGPNREEPAARTAMEAVVLSVCQQLVGQDDVGLDDRFVDLGIDSLTTVEMVVRLEAAVGVRLEPGTIGGTETAAGLASCIEEIVAVQHLPLAHLPALR